MLFKLIAARMGEHWQLSAEEATGLSVQIVNVMRHIPLPEKETQIAVDVTALTSTIGLVVYTRVAYQQFMMATGGLPQQQYQPAAPQPEPTPIRQAAPPPAAPSPPSNRPPAPGMLQVGSYD